MRFGVGVLGRRLLQGHKRKRRRHRHPSDAHRAVERELMGNRPLAKQAHVRQLPDIQLSLRRDVHVGVGVLGRRLLGGIGSAMADPR